MFQKKTSLILDKEETLKTYAWLLMHAGFDFAQHIVNRLTADYLYAQRLKYQCEFLIAPPLSCLAAFKKKKIDRKQICDNCKKYSVLSTHIKFYANKSREFSLKASEEIKKSGLIKPVFMKDPFLIESLERHEIL